MPLPPLTRYAELLRYERDRGVVQVGEWRADPQESRFIACAELGSVAHAIEAAVAGPWATPYLAGYGLALAARAWAGRPTDAQRGAIIQAAAQLRGAGAHDWRLNQLVEQALARADTALLAGQDAEPALLDMVGAAVSRADRVAERCGRIAAGLLDQGDRVLAAGDAGPALSWMLYVAFSEQDKPIALVLAGLASDETCRAAGIAREIGLPASIGDDQALDSALSQAPPSLFVAGATLVALDGSVAATPGAARYAALARQHGLPRYILGYDGPDASAPDAQSLAPADGVLPAELISAIITNRGIYRPEMIARHLGDGDAPLDVIPLTS